MAAFARSSMIVRNRLRKRDLRRRLRSSDSKAFRLREISSDHRGRLQAEHLIGLGHRRIGYAMPEHPLLRRIADDRLHGAAEACAQAGIDPPLALDTKLDTAVMARAARKWRREAVTAVCAYNDEVAIALLAGMRRAKLTAPADLAVIGTDDIPLAQVAEPPLSTVAFDLEKVGRSLAEAVVANLSGGRPRVTPAALAPYVIHRAST